MTDPVALAREVTTKERVYDGFSGYRPTLNEIVLAQAVLDQDARIKELEAALKRIVRTALMRPI